jgi:hypothetical protein
MDGEGRGEYLVDILDDTPGGTRYPSPPMWDQGKVETKITQEFIM